MVRPASPEAAASAAAYQTLVQLYPAQKATFDDALTASLSALPDGPSKTNGVDLGKAAAGAILDIRTLDGAALTETFPGAQDAGAGVWRATPPGFAAANEPQWRHLRPFVLTSPSQLRAPPPPALDGGAYLRDLDEVRTLGAKASATRTADQTEIAAFWAQATHVPVNEIARNVTLARRTPLEENARLFALLNVALADSRIAAWDSKYTYAFWRPVTSIRAASGEDPASLETGWEPFLTTPNHPEYVSGHSTTGAAGAAVLELYFGKAATFTVASDTLPGVTRSFTSFAQVAAENGRSRIFGGIHYQFSNQAGLDLGAAVGKHVFESILRKAGGPDGGAPDAGVIDSGSAGAGSGPAPLTADGGTPGTPATGDSSSCSAASAGMLDVGAGLMTLGALSAAAVLRIARRRKRVDHAP